MSLLDRLTRRRRQKAAIRAFNAFPIAEGDIVIDGGANIGTVTLPLVGRGARVFAYEPNPFAFAHLERAFGGHPQVTCLQKGLSDRNDSIPLYLHRQHDRDRPLGHSEAASLLADKRNIDARHKVMVDVVDIVEAVASAGNHVRLLKLDIEGAEYRVLHRLLDTGVIHRIDQVFCETHDHKAPSLRHETRRLRRRLAREGIRHVNLDWD